MKIKWLIALPAIFLFFTAQSLFARGVRIGPDGEFSPQTLKLPFAFYNENFGFAGIDGIARPDSIRGFAAVDEDLSARDDVNLKIEMLLKDVFYAIPQST